MTKVEIYSKATCPYCDRAKQLLDNKKVKYTEIRVDTSKERYDEMMIRCRNELRTVPQIYINDRLIGGFDDMLALDKAGKLDPLLQ